MSTMSSIIVLLALFSYASCANILGMFWASCYSHQSVYRQIWKELSLRGHKVTVITPLPLNDPTLVNLTEISVEFVNEFFENARVQDKVSKDLDVFTNLDNMYRFIEWIIEQELNSTQVRELISDQSKEFDLIMLEGFHPLPQGMAARFKAPTIVVASTETSTIYHDVIGNPSHPYLYPDFMSYCSYKEMSFWKRIKSIAFMSWFRIYHRFIALPRVHGIAKKYFGESIPYLGDLERNISMLFLNTNPLFHSPRPRVPALIELGQVHLKPAQPLPSDLQLILDNAKESVIYFSLGSTVKAMFLSNKLKTVILEALSELPYLVLWKYEADDLASKPKNVIIRKWFPQQDVLGHHNVKAFITQGGFQSIEEGIAREVPMVGMPLFGDQPVLAQRLVELEIGVQVDPSTCTKDELKNAIIEVAENYKYKTKIKKLRKVLFDKPMTGLENAIWWTEYVIRHGGSGYLRSPSADISWFHYLFLDVVLTIIASLLISMYLTSKFLRVIGLRRRSKLKLS